MARKPVKVVFRSRPLIMAVVMLLVITATVGMVTLQNSLDNSRSQFEAMRQQAAALEAANAELSANIAELGTIDSAIRIAEEELGLVDPDTIIFTPAND